MNLTKASSPTLGWKHATAVERSRARIAQYRQHQVAKPNLELPKSQKYLWKLPSFQLPQEKTLGNKAEEGSSKHFFCSLDLLRVLGWLWVSWLFMHYGNEASVLFVFCKLHLYLIFPEMPRSNLLTMTRNPCRRRYSQKSKALQQWKECAWPDWWRTNDFK